MKILCLPALVAGSMFFAVPFAHAQTLLGEMRVSAYVGQSCALSASPMAFNALTSGTTDYDTANAVITLDCSSPGVPTTVTVGNGVQPGTAPDRQMRSEDNYIPYTLYLDGGSTPLTHDNMVTLTVDGIDPTLFSATLDGRVPRSESYLDGVYVDTITLTTTYTFTPL
ncbi:MAG: spore coat protein U domain-containing protein [Natronohydrobacter sp.]|nr:spore coat protein U domain-containing protein [Paracoccaceae bacterium]MCC5967976.1 spore coat protein U domain-containing protein [Natronohydrobacter sp.]